MPLDGPVKIQTKYYAQGRIRFVAQWYENGVRHHENLAITAKRPTQESIDVARNQAYEYRNELEWRLRHPEINRPAPQVPLMKAVRAWIQVRRATKARDTARRSEAVMELFLDWLADAYPEIQYTDGETGGLQGKHALEWRDCRATQVAGGTLFCECGHLQKWLTFLVERDFRREGIRILPQGSKIAMNPKPPRFLTTEEVLGLILAEYPEPLGNYAAYVLAATGIRRGSLLRMQSSWFSGQEQILTIPPWGANTTKRKARVLPIGPQAATVLGQLAQQRGLVFPVTSPAAVNRWFEGQCKPHDFRRWFCQRLMKLQCPGVYRKALMAHSLGKRDEAYMDPEVEDLRPYMVAVDAMLPDPAELPRLQTK